MESDLKLAWLAGFWDGEGSVGFVRSRSTNILNAQLSHTDRKSVIFVLSFLRDLNIKGRGYTYLEREPKHRDAHFIRISGINNVLKLGKYLSPHAITKKHHWELAIEWAISRIEIAGGIDSSGHLFRGRSHEKRLYSQRENEIVLEMKELNRRGNDNRPESIFGRISI